jgi:hypothetical protein
MVVIQAKKRSGRAVILGILELIVAAIFILGGVSLLYFTTSFDFARADLDLVLGITHTSLGIIALPLALGIFMKKNWAGPSTIALNSVAVIFSMIAEIILYNESVLGASQFNDSVIGTIAGIVVALVVIYLVPKPGTR